ncbi:MAG: MFS transporter [Candidatus Adiutrix sp.]|nr:MFS transporter [Candidatus Adiutrix sp.]
MTLYRGRIALIIALSALVYIICLLHRLSPPVVALSIRDSLGLSADQMSLVFAPTLFGYGLIQPLAGFSVDRYGPRRCLMVSTFFMGLSAVWFSQADSMVSACLARALTGLASGLSLLPGLRLVLNWLEARYFGVAASSIMGASALANFTVGRPLAWLSQSFGWRFPFFWIGLISLAACALVFLLVRDKPPQTETAAPAPAGRRPAFLAVAFSILKNPMFWLLSGLYIGTDLLCLIFTSLWAGPYLIEVYGQSELAVGNILSVAAAGFLFGPTLLALWGDRWGSYPRVLLCLAFFSAAFWAFLIWGPTSMPLWSLYILCFLAPMGTWASPLYMSIARDYAPPEIASSAMGFINMPPVMAGAALQHLVGSLIQKAEDSGAALSPHALYAQAFTPVFIIAVLAAALAVVLVVLTSRKNAAAA